METVRPVRIAYKLVVGHNLTQPDKDVAPQVEANWSMHHVFRHRRYEIVEVHSESAGKCNWTDGRVELNPDVNGRLGLDTAIHEALHATYPELHENVVNEGAADIARFLWRLGYRLAQTKEK